MNSPSSHRNTRSRRWKHTLAALTTLSTLTALTAGAAQASNQYGAIAFNKQTRAYGYSYNHASQAAAEADAVARCAGSQCRSMMWFANGCGALAVGSITYGAGSGPTKAIALQQATDRCGRDDCKVLTWTCTDRRSH